MRAKKSLFAQPYQFFSIELFIISVKTPSLSRSPNSFEVRHLFLCFSSFLYERWRPRPSLTEHVITWAAAKELAGYAPPSHWRHDKWATQKNARRGEEKRRGGPR